MKLSGFFGRWNSEGEVRGLLQRRSEANRKLATQPWSEFWRNLGIEAAIIAGGVALLALVFWLVRLFL